MHIHAEEHGVVAEIDERTGITVSWTSIQAMEMGASSGTVCWHRMGESGGSVAGKDGRDDKVEKTENG